MDANLLSVRKGFEVVGGGFRQASDSNYDVNFFMSVLREAEKGALLQEPL